MKIVYNNIIPAKSYKAVNLFGVVFVRKGTAPSEVDVRHEQIHTEQIRETLYVGFYVLYLMMFIWQFVKAWNWSKAYRAVPFEREAYDNEQDENYLENRIHYGWKKYLYNNQKQCIMESKFTRRNIDVSILLTVVAFIVCWLICKPEAESGVDESNLAMYGACLGAAIGAVGEGVNYITQNPKSATWLGIFGAVLAGVFASQIV